MSANALQQYQEQMEEWHEDMPLSGAFVGDHLPEFYSIHEVIERPDKTAAVILRYSTHPQHLEQFTVGWFDNAAEAIETTIQYFSLFGENLVNVYKHTSKLFPHIKGVMLRGKPTVMTLSGYVKEIMPDGNADKSRLEIGFLKPDGANYDKTAIVNATQVMKLADMFGPESQEWHGEKVVLYAEDGTAFGKPYCAVRVANMNDPADKGRYGHLLAKKNGGGSAGLMEELEPEVEAA